jgi:hypothetical protein
LNYNNNTILSSYLFVCDKNDEILLNRILIIQTLYHKKIIPFKSYTWSTTTGSQSYWSPLQAAVPFGASFDCTNGITSAISILDLRNSTWRIDISRSEWFLTGNNVGSIDISNPFRVVLTSQGRCGSTSVTDSTTSWSGRGYIAVIYTPKQTLCQSNGLQDYPTTMIPPSVPGAIAICWLPLGASSIQRTRGHLTFVAGQVKTSTYNGIGVAVTAVGTDGYYTLDVSSQVWNMSIYPFLHP